jgi:hypothetical protein
VDVSARGWVFMERLCIAFGDDEVKNLDLLLDKLMPSKDSRD